MFPNNANTYLPGTIQISSTLLIIGMTQSYPMIISISVDPITAANTYIEGQLVKLNIPFEYGMQQANGITAKILAIDVMSNLIVVDINSINFDPFSIPINGEKPASLAPSGSNNLEFSNLTNQVPFQSLNNRGN